MNDLTELMRDATESLPPTSITIAGLVRQERRQARNQLMTAALAATAAGVALASIPLYTSSPSGGSARAGDPGTPPSGSYSPVYITVTGTPFDNVITGEPTYLSDQYTGHPELSGVTWPTEPAESAVPRLDAALNHALSPTGVTVGDGSNVSFQEGSMPSAAPGGFEGGGGFYITQLMLTDAQGKGLFQLTLSTEPRPLGTGCSRSGSCVQSTAPDGSYVEVYGPTDMDGGHLLSVFVFRPDHTMVQLYASDFYYPNTFNLPTGATPPGMMRTRPSPILSADQLIAIGTAPGITLYP